MAPSDITIHVDNDEDERGHFDRRAFNELLRRVVHLERQQQEDREQFRRIHTALEAIMKAIHQLTDVPVAKSVEVRVGSPR